MGNTLDTLDWPVGAQTTRTLNALRFGTDITTIRQLANTPDNKLRRVPNLGKRGLALIRRIVPYRDDAAYLGQREPDSALSAWEVIHG